MKEFIVKCGSCETLIVAKAEKEGDFVDCPRCQAVVEIQAAGKPAAPFSVRLAEPMPRPRPPASDGGLDQDIVAWALKQRATISMSLPTRAPNEPDANAEQLAEIQSLATVEPAKLKELGTWQADAVIRRIREEKKELTDLVVNIAQAEQARRDIMGCVTALLIVGLIALIIWWLR